MEGLPEGTTVYADKGYDSEENRQHLEEHRLQDGIMRKAHRNHPLSETQTKRNRYLSKTRYVVEQSFGTLHRKFRYARAAYFGLIKVNAQSHLKAMCLNLLKAANRLSAPQNRYRYMFAVSTSFYPTDSAIFAWCNLSAAFIFYCLYP